MFQSVMQNYIAEDLSVLYFDHIVKSIMEIIYIDMFLRLILCLLAYTAYIATQLENAIF